MIVDFATYVEGTRSECGSLDEAVRHARATPGAFVWIGVADPDADQVHALAELLDLPPLAVEDIDRGRQRSTLETYPGLTVLAVSPLHYDDAREAIETGHVMALTSDRVVLTLRYGQSVGLAPVRAALEQQPELLAYGLAAVGHAVVDRIVDDYGRVLADVEQIEVAVFENDHTNNAERIYRLTREVLEFRRALGPVLAPLDRLVHDGLPGLTAATARRILSCRSTSATCSPTPAATTTCWSRWTCLLDSASEANSSQVSMAQNPDQRKITAWAAIALFPTIGAGIYGMNFARIPGTGLAYGFEPLIAVTALVYTSLYLGFRRNDWL